MKQKTLAHLKSKGLALSIFLVSSISLGANSFQFSGESLNSFTPDKDFTCTQQKNTVSNAMVSQCLNAYSDFILRDSGKLANEFYNEDPLTPEGKFNEFARIRDFDPSIHTKLSTFRIKVPLTADVDISRGKSCFNYTAMSKENKIKTILSLKKQIENAAEFLSHHHVKSSGSRNSWFFHLSQIELCSSENFNNRNFVYSRHKLHIALDGTRGHLKTFDLPEISSAWKSDNVIRRVESNMWTDIYSWTPIVGKKIRAGVVYSKSGKEGVALDLIAEKWDVLNPTGLLRSDIVADIVSGLTKAIKGEGILSTLHKKILIDSKEETTTPEHQAIKNELLKITLSGPGLEAERTLIKDADKESLATLYSKYIKIANDRFTIVEMLENGIKESIMGVNPLHNANASKTFKWTDRTGVTAVGATVFNNKEINVFFQGFAPGDALPITKFSKSSNTPTNKPPKTDDKESFILVTEDMELAKKAAEIDSKTLEELQCGEHDSSDVCKIKALSLKISDDSMLYTDDDVTIIKYVPGMSYDINTDKVFTLVGASIDLIDDVNVLASLKLPSLSSGMVQRYALAKAVRKTSLSNLDTAPESHGLELK